MSEIRKNRIVLLGYGRLALALLKGLLETGQCEIVGVFRWARHPKFRGRQDNDDKRLFDLTRDTKIPDLHFDGANSTDFHNFIEQNQVDTVLIATWGEIIRPPTLNIPGVRFVNCHPSLLPAHRGANPYSSVIRNGERQTGVTFHIVDESIDTGAIVLQSAVEVTEHDTGDTLRRRCAMTAKQLAAELCDRLNHPNKMTLTQQKDIGTPSYFPTLKPSDGLIDWSKPAKQIHDLIRGVQPWIDPYTFVSNWIGSIKLIIRGSAIRVATRSPKAAGTVTSIEDDTIWVQTGDKKQEIGLRNVHLCLGSIPLPQSLARLARMWWIRPGSVLKAANKKHD